MLNKEIVLLSYLCGSNYAELYGDGRNTTYNIKQQINNDYL